MKSISRRPFLKMLLVLVGFVPAARALALEPDSQGQPATGDSMPMPQPSSPPPSPPPTGPSRILEPYATGHAMSVSPSDIVIDALRTGTSCIALVPSDRGLGGALGEGHPDSRRGTNICVGQQAG